MSLPLHVGTATALLIGVLAASGEAQPAERRSARPGGPAGGELRRLDGTRLSASAADAFARRTLDSLGVTGAQIAVVNDGRLVWSAAYGLRGRASQAGGTDLPMRRTTTTWAASITKAVFATYVMQLVERGAFDLDLPVARQLPQPLDRYPAYREKAALLVADPAWARVTPRMLLAHTAGLLNFATYEPDGRMRLHGTPGAAYRYSGEGINLVGFIVEQRLGAPLDALMQAAVFGPAGMTRTSMVWRPELADDVADRFGADGQFLSQTRRSPARAAGSMTSSAEDLAAFVVALFDGRLLRPATRAAMLRPHVHIRTRAQFGPGADPADTLGGAEARAVGLAYGLGWGLLTSTRYGPAFFKEGHGDGAQTYLVCFERGRTCMAILTNSDNGELAYRPLLETLVGASVIPWEWHGYTPAAIAASRAGG
ncbi:MAG TPA: serine hydrolase domain-containing protein [Gemmatirosa sp.]|nr:serine hydrolase domain-containing protein [Gemmatirosa sp.]